MEVTKEEYWFLDLVIRYSWSLFGLDGINLDIESEANKPGHDLNHAEVVNVLHHLFQNEDLVAFRQESFGAEPSPYFVPNLAEIENGIAGRDRIFFRLTAKGGARWESVSNPNWNAYVEVSSSRSAYTIISANQSLIRQWIQAEIEPVFAPKWSILTPWQVTYWKSLPTGHQVDYKHKKLPSKSQSRHRSQDIDRKEELLDKLWNKLDKWYTNPWRDKEWYD